MSSKELIFSACEKGDLPQLRCVLEETELDVGSEPLGSEGETALHVACAHGHLDIVQYLVNDKGCIISAPNSTLRAVGATPLVVAWANKHWEVVEFLLNAIQGRELYAEVGLAQTTVTQLQEVAKYCNEALHQACIHGYLEVVKFLTCSSLMNRKGCDPTAVSSHGTTPLQLAWENKHWKVGLHLLLDMIVHPGHVSGLSPTAITQLLKMVEFREDAASIRYPLHQAVLLNHVDLLQNLQSIVKCSFNEANQDGETPLHIACRQCSIEVVQMLVANKRSDLNVQNNTGETALHIAVYSKLHAVQKVQSILHSDRCNPNITNSEGHTPLHVAMEKNNFETAMILLNNSKCNVNETNSAGDTVLHLACRSRYSRAILEKLVENNRCDINAQNNDSNTALHVAIYSGTGVARKVTCLLTNERCNPNITNSAGDTVLHLPCKNSKVILKNLAEDSRCDLNAQDHHGNTALHVAIYNGTEVAEKVKCIVMNERCNPNITNSKGYTPLHVAVEKENFETATILLNNSKCNVNKTNAAGDTVLHLACRLRYSKAILEKLVENSRCDLNAQNNDRNTALHVAIYSGTEVALKVTCILMNERCNPNITNSAGDTVLRLACRLRYSKAILEKLVEDSRCDLNARDHHGNTALHVAIYSGTEVAEKVKCIVMNERCNPNITNSEGYTPLHVALEKENLETAMILSECNVNETNSAGDTVLHLACRLRYSKAKLEKLVENGRCDLNAQNNHGNTALHDAIYSGTEVALKVTCILMNERCNPNITNSAGDTVLHRACRLRYSKAILEKLVENSRCDLNAKNSNDNTALHLAVYSRTAVAEKVQCMLQSERCNPNITNNEGYTPLHVAVSTKQFEIAKILSNHSQCNPNYQDLTGNTPLHMATREMSLINVEPFLNHKHIDLSVQNREGNTPLHVAVMKQSPVDVVEALTLHKSCNPSLVNNAGMTPLQISVTSGYLDYAGVLITSGKYSHEDIVKATEGTLHLACRTTKYSKVILENLVEDSRCDLNARDHHGNTALHVAIYSGIEVAEKVKCIVMNERCNPNITNSEGYTPLHVAVEKENFETAMILLNNSKCNVNETNSAGDTVLHLACRLRYNKAILEKLVQNSRCDQNAQNNHGNTALHVAIYSGTEVALKVTCILMSERCNPNITNSAGDTVLHLACRTTKYSKTIPEKLVEDSRCDPNAQDHHGNTALHVAIYSGTEVAEKVKCIVINERCNPNITNSEGYTPLHVAVEKNNFETAMILLNNSKCNVNETNSAGDTVLHLACRLRYSKAILEKLVENSRCDLNAKNSHGVTALHVAVCSGTDVDEKVQCMLQSERCNPNITNSEGYTPLHVAVSKKLFEVAKILASAGSNVNVSNSEGETALHIACKEGNAKATKLLLQNGADLIAVDRIGYAPIHVACAHMTFDCLTVLLGNHGCNPNQQNVLGQTPLHILCRNGETCDMRMVDTLLSTPGINPECADHLGQIPAELAGPNYSIIEKISKYLQHKNTQLETYLKIFVVGNSGGGKSTLIKAVITERSKHSLKAKHINPSEVSPHTAGIVPLPFKSKHFGHAVLYDFAGQHEYYSSHAAVMENLVLPSPPLFLLLIDISKPMDEIKEELIYWWMFINNHSKRTAAPPHVILVGSHKDIVKERRENVQQTMEQIMNIIRDIPVSFQFDHSKTFVLDCRKLVSQGLTTLLTQLKLTCQTLRQTADIDLHCHILKAFLTTNFDSRIACKASEIAKRINQDDVLLPKVPSQLMPLLSTLSDKGHILLLQYHTDVSKSWVVLKPELLLAEVNGSIFAPDSFKEHCSGFAMSTGVVTLSNIKKEFVNYSSQVIIGYLTHLEFCFQIKDQHTLEMITKDTTLQLTAQGSEHAEKYYFFPALIQKENPSDVCQPQETIKYECGWFYRCNEPTEQLTTRFLHVLILRLAFSCEPPDEPTQGESVVLLRSCSVWKHGIAWWTSDGIETIVEVGLQCRWVAVMLRCPDTHKVQCAELRTKVISTVLKTKQDFCPAITMKEYLIAPSSLQYPFEGRELTLYSMREIAKVIITGKDFPKDLEGKSVIHISQLLPFEPFFNIGEDLIGNLFISDESRKAEVSQDKLLQIASKCFEKIDDFQKALQPNLIAFQRECVKHYCTDHEMNKCVALFWVKGYKTWRDFEQEFSSFSIFCGRNPMDFAWQGPEPQFPEEKREQLFETHNDTVATGVQDISVPTTRTTATAFHPSVQRPPVQVEQTMRRDERPDLPTLGRFPHPSGHINIMQEVVPQYKQLGNILLRSGNGVRVLAMEETYAHVVKNVVYQMWLVEDADATWGKLVQCLIDANLNPLAEEIDRRLV